jgi:hypothetical protein
MIANISVEKLEGWSSRYVYSRGDLVFLASFSSPE